MRKSNWLYKQLKTNNLTQARFSELAKISQPSVSNAVRGKNIGLKSYRAIARFFGYTIDEVMQLLEGSDSVIAKINDP